MDNRDSNSANPRTPAPRPRHDGWTVERQMAFIRMLHATGCVTRAAAAAGMSREGAYRLRARADHCAFAGAWDLALAACAARAAKRRTGAAEGHSRVAKGHGFGHRRSAFFSDEGHERHGPARIRPHRQVDQLVRFAEPAVRSIRPLKE